MPVLPARLIPVLALLLAACGAGRTAELPLVPARSGGATALRVMTLNMKSAAFGLDGIVSAIRAADPDIVGLQEVDVGTRRAGGIDQAAELARRTGLSYSVHFPVSKVGDGDYGLAILARWPLSGSWVRPLHVYRGIEPRRFARAEADMGDRRIAIYVTHFSHLPHRGLLRLGQAEQVLRAMAHDPLPKVLLGDFNEVAASRGIRRLSSVLTDAFAHAGSGPSGTYPLPVPLGPTLRFDYVFASRELEPVSSRVLQGGASDHHAVIADLLLAGEASASADAAPAGADRNPDM